MKRLLSLLLIGLLLWSCVEVKFELPQPKGIKDISVIPESLQGKYAVDKDTLEIKSDGIAYSNDSLGKQDIYKISDNFKIRKWRNTYFLNVKEKDDSLWSVFFMTVGKNKQLSIGYLSYNTNNEENIEKLKSITKVREVRNENDNIDFYLLNPSRCQLRKIMKQVTFQDFGQINKQE